LGTEEPSSPPPEPPRKRVSGFARSFVLATELPVILVAAILVGGGLGYLLDSRMQTTPLWTLLFGLAGFGVGIREILSRLKKEAKNNAGK
jgi:F0F1-type ATP synthase assembly protein I